MHTRTYTHIHTCIHTCMHTYICTYLQTYRQTNMHTYILTHIRIHTHATYIYIRAHVHACIHMYMHACMHTYITPFIFLTERNFWRVISENNHGDRFKRKTIYACVFCTSHTSYFLAGYLEVCLSMDNENLGILPGYLEMSPAGGRRENSYLPPAGRCENSYLPSEGEALLIRMKEPLNQKLRQGFHKRVVNPAMLL